MFTSVSQLKKKLAARPDSEHVQIYLRILAGLGGITYCLLANKYTTQIGGWDLLTQAGVVVGGILVGGLGFFAHIVVSPGTNNFRRWLGAIHDTAWVGLAMYALGDVGTIFFGMYIWVVIGNGFRYGTTFLYGSAGFALLSFYAVAYFNPYYGDNFGLLGLGTFLLGFVIPIYLGGLLKQLQRSLVAAREADRLKTRFLSNVSHDLRTPLNAIMANCDLLSRDPSRVSRQSRRLQDMREAASTLNDLLVDLLDVARIEAGKVRIVSSTFNLVELLARITRFNRTSAQAKGTQVYLTVAPELPLQVYGDALRLEQVLNNIVSNAVKYTDKGEVSIYARPTFDARGGSCNGIVCSVRDTGIGMEPEALGRIFSRFEQADLVYARRYSGAGLGLNIAHELTALMGGCIEVESTKGVGSCFTLRVPLRPDSGVEPSSPRNAMQRPVTVLCQHKDRRKYWLQVFADAALPAANILTIEDLTHTCDRTAGTSTEPGCLLVDACDIDIPIDQITLLLSRSPKPFLGPRMLVGTPPNTDGSKTIPDAYKKYHSWSSGAGPNDIRKALTIAYWMTGSEPSKAESDEKLRSWMRKLRGVRVLVADDNELNRHVLSDMLAYTGARVTEASNGAEALAILSVEPIDIALLDIQMPDLTGMDVMRAYAERRPQTPVPIIALTADTTDECRSQCLATGAKSILYKPVNMNTLYSALYEAVADVEPATSVEEQQRSTDHSSEHLLDYTLLNELARTGRRPDYMASLVSCFRREGDNLLKGLGQALQLNNLVGGRALLHRLKGMSGSIGASEMASACQDGLSLSDAELSATANSLTSSLLELHSDSALQLDAFSHALATSG